MSRRRATLTTMAGSSLSAVIAASQAIVLLPLYVSSVGTSTYGAWLAASEALLCLLAFDLGLPHLLIQRVGALWAKGDEEAVGRYLGTCLALLTWVSSVLLALVLVFSRDVVGQFLEVSQAYQVSDAVSIAAAATAMTIVSYVFIGYARAVQETTVVNAANVIGTSVGFLVTYRLLVTGYGLSAIAWGMVIRAAILLAGCLAFFFFSRVNETVRSSLRFSRECFLDFKDHAPALAVAGFSNALMTNSHATIVALVISPQSAVAYSVTRKVADLVKSFLDMIGYSSVGGFAHAWESKSADERRRLHNEIVATYFALAGGGLGAYIAINGPFISLWMGQEFFGGPLLTVALASGVLASGWSQLELTLLRATGEVSCASYAMFFECVARTTAMVVLAIALGSVGIPVAVIATSAVVALWSRKKMNADEKRTVWLSRIAPLAVGAIVAAVSWPSSWPVTLAVGIAVSAASLLYMTRIDPLLHRYWPQRSWRRVWTRP